MKHNWKYKRLDEVGIIITGSTPSTSNPRFYSSHDYMFIKPGDIKEDYINLLSTSDTYVSKEAYDTVCRKLPKHSVLLTCIGIIGKVGVLENEATCNQQINSIIPKDSLHYKYLAYALIAIKDLLNSKKNGPVVPIINKTKLSSFMIPVPPMEVQELIVAELDKLNEMIATRKEQLKELDNLAQSLFYNTFGDPVTNPKGWEVKKLGELCNISSAKRVLVEDVVKEGIPFIRGTELAILSRQNSYDESVFSMFITPEHYEKVKAITGVPSVGDLLIPSINADGYVWVVNTPKPLYFKDGRVLWVHVNNELFSSQWLRYALSKMIQVKYANLSRGAVFAELTLVFLRNLSIIVPPITLQRVFDDLIESIEHQKEIVKASIAELQTLLDSRMDYWFN